MNSYEEFMKEMNKACMGKKQNNEEKIIEMMQYIFESQTRILDLLKDQDERIRDVNERLYEMLPETEIIEAMAEDKGERMDLYKRYLNVNEDY